MNKFITAKSHALLLLGALVLLTPQQASAQSAMYFSRCRGLPTDTKAVQSVKAKINPVFRNNFSAFEKAASDCTIKNTDLFLACQDKKNWRFFLGGPQQAAEKACETRVNVQLRLLHDYKTYALATLMRNRDTSGCFEELENNFNLALRKKSAGRKSLDGVLIDCGLKPKEANP